MDAKTQQRYLVLSFMSAVLFGSIYAILQKMLYLTKGEDTYFYHPYFVSFLISISMVMVYPVLLIKERLLSCRRVRSDVPLLQTNINEDDEPNLMPSNFYPPEPGEKPKIWMYFIPSSFDVMENTCRQVSLTMISQSIVLMMRSSTLIYCALLAMAILKRKIYRHHVTSLFVILGGVSLVGYAYLTGNSTTNENIAAGLIILQVGQAFGSVAYIAEEKFVTTFSAQDPMTLAIGEGLCGCTLFIVALPILQFIPCDADLLCRNGKVSDMS